MKQVNFALIIIAIQAVAAFWRMPCRGAVGLARLDPLVNPGEVSQHVHSIHGSSGFGDNATYEDLVSAECTSCGVIQDKSVYWAPTLYFRHADGTYELVEQVGGMLNYYFLYNDDANPSSGIKAFPAGFRMIAGDSLRRNYSVAGLDVKQADPEKSIWAMLGQTGQDDLQQRALGFNCLNYQRDPEGSLYRHYLPDKSYLDANCADGVRFEIMFPSCWDGKNIDSHNHKDHVAYPDLVMNGRCPKGFNVKLPGLFYETIWATNAFVGKDGEFVISNGDLNGFGYHADFMMGWDVGFLQTAVNDCTNPSGRVEDCPHFTLQSEDEQRQCKMKLPSMLGNEKVAGVVGNSLPGNVQIQYGPGPATVVNPGPPTATVAVPTVSYSAGTQPTDTVYVPGQIFKELSSSTVAPAAPSSSSGSSSSEGVAALAQPEITPAPEPPAPVDDGYEIIRTDYVTEGNLVNMIIVKEKIEYVTIMTTTYTSTTTVPALNARHAGHMHRHARRHRR
ncbi:hypothetical protein QBC47DRAFT_19531 [Echria macrotheca]|uniref:DUF1996 domain-containing protein n=1 Tax=Echria macrotheca TaxID=438768 RepID=A0AAJ0BPZ2_9PEZI|nr:hypothetical protein QBC47DRAFT_19531 [Echria macrotheca]